MDVYQIRECEWCKAAVRFNEFIGDYEYDCTCTEDDHV